MQIWRMRPDGSSQERVTQDDYANWFPHPSPDGKWLVMLSYDKSVEGHPPNKDVALRIMPIAGLWFIQDRGKVGLSMRRRKGAHNLAVGNARLPPPEGHLRSRTSATQRSGPQGGQADSKKRS
jgi:hypothetical protein